MTHLPSPGPPGSTLQKRLRANRLAMLVRVLIVLGAVALVVGVAWVWVVPGHAHSADQGGHRASNIDQMALHTQVLGGLLDACCPPAIVMLAACCACGSCSVNTRSGRVFSHRALVSLRGFARCVLATGFVSPLYGGAAVGDRHVRPASPARASSTCQLELPTTTR